MLNLQLRQSTETQAFLNRFNQEKRGKVAQYLITLGIDIARKLGDSSNPNQLFYVLQQQAKAIENDGKKGDQKELRGEIRKIQDQLAQLNKKLQQDNNNSEQNKKRITKSKPAKPEKAFEHPRYHQQVEDQLYGAEEYNRFNYDQPQYDFNPKDYKQPKFAYDDTDYRPRSNLGRDNFHYQTRNPEMQAQQQNDAVRQHVFKGSQNVQPYQQYSSPNTRQSLQQRYKSPRAREDYHNQQNLTSHSQDKLTGKITESSPPPIVYIKNMNTQMNIRHHHLDDHQIKELLYDKSNDMRYTPQKHQSHNVHHSTPKSLHYNIQFKSPKSNQFYQSPPSNYDQAHYQTHQMNQNQSQSQHVSSGGQMMKSEGTNRQSRNKDKTSKPRQRKEILSPSDQQNKKVPQYLQKVQSKIKDQVHYHKQLYQQYGKDNQYNPDQEVDQQPQIDDYEEQDQNNDQYGEQYQQKEYQQQHQNHGQPQDWDDFDNDRINVVQEQSQHPSFKKPQQDQDNSKRPHYQASHKPPTQYPQFAGGKSASLQGSRETETYYDIQQYLIDQRNSKQFSFSPVQEVNAGQV